MFTYLRPPTVAALLVGLAFGVTAGVAAGATSEPSTQATQPASQPVCTQPSTQATQPASQPSALTRMTLASVQTRRKRVQDAPHLSAEAKAQVDAVYEKVEQELKLQETLQADMDRAKEQAERYVAAAAAAREGLAAAASQPGPATAASLPADANSLDDAEFADRLRSVQAGVRAAEADLAEKRKKVTSASDSLRSLGEAEKSLEARRTEATRRVGELGEQLVQVSANAGNALPEMASVNRQLLLAERQRRRQELETLEKSRENLPLRREALEAEKALAARQVASLERQAGAMRGGLEALQQVSDQRLKRAKELALRQAAAQHPVVGLLAAEDLALTRLAVGEGGRAGLREELRRASGRLEAVRRQMAKIARDRESIQEKVRVVGMTDTIGLLLRQHRSELPEARGIRGEIAARQDAVVQAELKRLELRDRLELLSDLEAQVALRMAAASGLDEARREHVRLQVAQRLEAIRGTLAGTGQVKGLVALQEEYAGALTLLDVEQTRLIGQAEQFAKFIDEHVLWIRSTRAVDLGTLRDVPAAAEWLTSPGNWRQAGSALWQDVRNHPVLDGLLAAALAALAAGARRLWRRRGEAPARARAWAGAPAVRLARAQAGAAGMAMWVPAAMLAAAWRMGQGDQAGPFARAMSEGLAAAGWFLLPLMLLRTVCARGGLGEQEFAWSRAGTGLARRAAGRLAAAGTPLVLLVVLLEAGGRQECNVSLGRMLFVLTMAALALATGHVLRPRGPVMAALAAGRRDSLWYRLRLVWLALVLAGPWALAALALAGYYYSAMHVAWRLLAQVWLAVGLLAAHGLLRRWAEILRRMASGAAPQADASVEAETPEQRLERADTQARRLMRTLAGLALVLGSLAIWSDVMPALGLIGRVELWRTSYGGDAAAVPVTLADAALAMIVFLATVAVSRNVSGILEIAFLHRLNITSGGRYAVVAIARYAVVVIGVVAGFHAIGVTWRHVQWIVAAVSLGLGFGLQEIFANFISGLIVLVERPIRVGDMVTVGPVTGRVTNIRMRATTIQGLDRKELVVPNKEFITGQLVNWSLSDEVVRLSVKVGLAYGSDTRQARELMLKVAGDNPRVLSDPPPQVLFTDFGASSLDFELRAFVGDVDDYPRAIDELHQGIDDAFRQAGLSMSFPQMDVHVVDLPRKLEEAKAATGADSGRVPDAPKPDRQ